MTYNKGGWWEEIQKKPSQVRHRDNTNTNYLAFKQEIVLSSFENVFPISCKTRDPNCNTIYINSVLGEQNDWNLKPKILNGKRKDLQCKSAAH